MILMARQIVLLPLLKLSHTALLSLVRTITILTVFTVEMAHTIVCFLTINLFEMWRAVQQIDLVPVRPTALHGSLDIYQVKPLTIFVCNTVLQFQMTLILCFAAVPLLSSLNFKLNISDHIVIGLLLCIYVTKVVP